VPNAGVFDLLFPFFLALWSAFLSLLRPFLPNAVLDLPLFCRRESLDSCRSRSFYFLFTPFIFATYHGWSVGFILYVLARSWFEEVITDTLLGLERRDRHEALRGVVVAAGGGWSVGLGTGMDIFKV
jgi:hypothetical protein